jgi:putative transposase
MNPSYDPNTNSLIPSRRQVLGVDHNHLKGTNMLERINQELKRRTHVIRIFPNQESCLRLIRALAVEIHEDWLEGPRYLNMEMLRQQRKQLQLLDAVLS